MSDYICGNCGDTGQTDELADSPISLFDVVCPRCGHGEFLSYETFRCDGCGNITDNDEKVRHKGMKLCQKCYKEAKDA